MEAEVLHKKKSLSPKLRFKGFSGGWKKKDLKDFTKINQGLQIAISERFSEQVDGSLFYITNEFLRKESKKSYFIKNPPQSVICNEDDLLMTRTGNTGQVVTGVHGAFHNNFFKIKFDSSCEKWFLYYFLTSYRTQHNILKLAGTSTIPDLNHSDFYKIKINIPEYPEQQKIASFLSVVDEKIQQLTSKKELLEQYKKGVMQQLFSGKLRFKDENGEAFPKWEEKRLGDVFEFFRGSPISKSDLSETGKYLCIHYGELFTSYSEVINSIKSKTDLENGFFSIKGDILMPSSDVTPKGLAKASSIQLDKVILGGDMNILRPTINQDSIFFSYLINFNQQKIIQKVTGTTVKHIYNRDVKLLDFNVPNSFDEQKKIANYLSNIDSKIESVTKQISETQTFKKGLLQQMFV